MNVTIFGDRLLLRPLNDMEAGDANSSGIILINKDAKENQAVIVQVGPDVQNKALVQGAKVLLTKFSMKEELKLSESNVLAIVKEADIIGVLS